MPEISAGAQVFDLAFHPTHSTVYTGLLTGHVRAFAYDDQGQSRRTFSVRPSKRSCRALCLDADGSHLYAVGKAKSLNIIDTITEDVEIRPGAHDSAINRIKYLMPSLLSTGDDDGVIKLWDPRQKGCIRKYTHHFDYITDFLWLEDKKQLVATSGDGTLSVMDVRSKKAEPLAQSEDQEDELLSIVAIKGHPHSIDALCTLPPDLTGVDATSTILTGSSDGFVRAVEILPTKLVGVVADHGDWPVERIAIGGGMSQLTLDAPVGRSGGHVGENAEDDDAEDVGPSRSRWWVGSVGHEETLRLTDLEAFFHEARHGDKELEQSIEADEEQQDTEDVEEDDNESDSAPVVEPEEKPDVEEDSDEEDAPKGKKRKRKPEKNPLVVKKKGRNIVEVSEPTFFDGL
ncbi:hypothetical protein H0H92_002936 [Tricholoma furcatifolium]|nr:hypothetical protein H0H92_002936 [Tricholoma furcatifolium]